MCGRSVALSSKASGGLGKTPEECPSFLERLQRGSRGSVAIRLFAPRICKRMFAFSQVDVHLRLIKYLNFYQIELDVKQYVGLALLAWFKSASTLPARCAANSV